MHMISLFLQTIKISPHLIKISVLLLQKHFYIGFVAVVFFANDFFWTVFQFSSLAILKIPVALPIKAPTNQILFGLLGSN